MRRRWTVLLVALLASCWFAAAWAHQINLSNARIAVNDDQTVDVEVAMKGSDVDRVAGTRVFDAQTGLVRPDALAVSAAAVED